MANICLYLHAHQPFRLRKFSIFEIGGNVINKNYFDDETNNKCLKRIILKSYIPTINLFKDLIKKTNKKFHLGLSVSGVLLEQIEKQNPEVIDLLKSLVNTGVCELIGETYYHSLASYFSEKEFRLQLNTHKKKLRKVFDFIPKTFRNTELLYYNQLAPIILDMGYNGVLIEGADKILMGRSPNFVYSAKNYNELKLLTKNYRLSDDIAFRFSDSHWREYPLSPSKFLSWIKASLQEGKLENQTINIFMDYETFGEHQWRETGIFDFFESFVLEAISQGFKFLTPGEVIQKNNSRTEELNIVDPLTWADTERDLSAWIGNDLQKDIAYRLYGLEKKVLASKNAYIINQWRRLQTSDHFYYVCTKWSNDGDVHKYFNPYDSPYDAYVNYMNILRDLEFKLS
ncbi:MAG: glycoside hydrolase family 57 protein [Candidatus Paceibacterota bacterium]|jgi:alpha-amylase